MELSRRWKSIALLAGMALVACGKEPAVKRDSSPASAPATKTPVVASDCPRTGHWSSCQVKKRLEQSGLAPRDTAALGDLPNLGVTPVTLMIGNAGVAYYLFPDTLSRHAAAATLDTVRFIPQSKPLSMRNEPTRIENDNLLAILLSRNEHQRERVSDAITAGPPQP